MKPLTKEERLRYHRQIVLPEVGGEGQQRLSAAKVTIVGAGGLGCPVLTYLVAAGVGRIKIVDGDRVDITNLHRQPLYTENDIGTFKAEVATRVARAAHPAAQLVAVSEYISRSNVERVLADSNLIIDCTDNFAAKYLLNDACVQLGMPLVSASLFRFEGQVTIFNACAGEIGSDAPSPTYRCLYPSPPPAGSIPSCAEAGVLGVLPGLVGTLQATEALKLILRTGTPLAGKLLVIDALTMEFTKLNFSATTAGKVESYLHDSSYYEALLPTCTLTSAQITARELRSALDNNTVTLIDVRERTEHKDYSIGGLSIPLEELDDSVSLIPRDKPIVVYCSTGVRSEHASTVLLTRHGFSTVMNLENGLLGWDRFHSAAN